MLPAAGWKPLGSETYVYSGPDRLLGPCTRAKLTGRRDASFGTRVGGLSLACHGALLGFTLDEPAQRSLGVRFRIGSVEQCFLLGGTAVQDRPATPRRTGLFTAGTPRRRTSARDSVGVVGAQAVPCSDGA